MKKYLITIPLLIIACVVLLAACTGKPRPFVIGVSQCSEDIWRNKLNDELKMGEFLNDSIIVKLASSNDDNVLQNKQINQFVDEGVDLLDEAEAASKAATPRRITYDVSAHDADRGCAVAYCMGTGPEEGRWLKVYMQASPGLRSYLNMICRDKVFVHDERE